MPRHETSAASSWGADAHSIARWSREYADLGFALVPIPLGLKGPREQGWQHNTITDPARAKTVFQRPQNMGLEHGKSQTGTFDIDSLEDAALALAAVGLELEALLSHPTAKIRGKNASKPLYDLTGLELPYRKLTWPHPTERLANGRPKQYTVFELRAGPGKQDVLPPSLHPDGITYRWEPRAPHSRADLLPPPPELLALWQDAEHLTAMRKACPWREVEASPKAVRRPPRTLNPGESVIAAWNERHSLSELLERYGYVPRGYGRYLPPESRTGMAGAVVYQKDGVERMVVYNASSPLCQVDATGTTRSVNAFDVWLEYEHGGDLNAAVRTAAEELNMRYEPKEVWSVSPFRLLGGDRNPLPSLSPKLGLGRSSKKSGKPRLGGKPCL